MNAKEEGAVSGLQPRPRKMKLALLLAGFFCVAVSVLGPRLLPKRGHSTHTLFDRCKPAPGIGIGGV